MVWTIAIATFLGTVVAALLIFWIFLIRNRACKKKGNIVGIPDSSTARPRKLGLGALCSVTKFAFADTRSLYIEPMDATAPCLVQTPKRPSAFSVSVENSKREKLLKPDSNQ